MSDITITYFDFPGGRGEDARLALHLAGVDFTDDRVGREWPERKPTMPFNSLPVLTVDGEVLGQSNAILRFLGNRFGLHPTDAIQAARHDAILDYVEELRQRVAPVMSLKDPERQPAREAFAEDFMQTWGANVEAQIEGPFLSGETLNVADLKLFTIVGFYKRGGADHIRTDVFSAFPKLEGLHAAVAAHPKVQEWYSRF